MRRRIQDLLTQDLGKKIQVLSGSRQVGKTTLSQQLLGNFQYLNYDRAQTGSARPDTYRRVGDSLGVRYFQYRLNPLTLNELKTVEDDFQARQSFTRMLNCSGFPEPYLDGTSTFYQRWRATHLDIILRQDLVDLETVSSIQAVEQLIHLLTQQVGSTVSYSSLARTLQVSDKTIKRWLGILESLYVLFRVTPYAQKQSHVISKAPKFYFYDIARVDGDEGARFENLVALALQSELDFMKDSLGKDLSLQFLRKKDGREIDFVIADRVKIRALIECKWRDGARSPNFSLAEGIPQKKVLLLQLVAELEQEKTFHDGCEIRSAPE